MLDVRLALCAEMVRRGKRVADIGTDHAYLPVYLVGEGICPSAVASDLREGPLNSARKNIAAAGLESMIRTVLADGLSGISPDDADDIVIAGMGGHLTVSILGEAGWLANPHKRLILQPMTDIHVVRRYLFENGFEILQDRAVRDAGHIYCVISAAYTGTKTSPGEAACRAGMLCSGGECELAYIRREITRLHKKAEGLKCAALPPENPVEVENVISELSEIATKMEEKL